MEVRMQPRSEAHQRCLSFTLDVSPAANITQYRDSTGNNVHHFDIAGSHTEVKVVAQSTVQVQPVPAPRPSEAGDWADLDATTNTDDYWEMMLPSQFARSSEALEQLANELKIEQRGGPLQVLTELNEGIYNSFAYVPNSTKVDSAIEDALLNRQGVCQDFAHIMIALARSHRIPSRYVSGYLFHREENGHQDRSLEGASHAWVEALVDRKSDVEGTRVEACALPIWPHRIPSRYVSGYLFHREKNGHQDRSLEGASHAWVEAL